MIVIRYSRGTNIHDVQPAQRVVANFAEFVDALDKDRAATKQGAGYFCAPLSEGSKRTAAAVLPRRWIALDLDKIDADVLPSLRLWFAGFSGAAWPTHSSTEEQPRERAIIELSRAVSRDEGIAIGRALAHELSEQFGDAVLLDLSTTRGEQCSFVAPTWATLARFEGAPLDVDRYLEAARDLPDDARHEHAQEPDRDAEPEHASAQVLRDLADALRVLDADDRTAWVRVGHALKRLGDDGRRLWLTWSATSPKYSETDACRVWTSFRGDHSGYRAVFAAAQAAGWRNPGAAHASDPDEAATDSDSERVLADAQAVAAAAEAGDKGAPFEPAALATLRSLKDQDFASWVRLRERLKRAGVGISELDKQLQRGSGASSAPEDESVADRLIALARARCELMHDSQREAFAVFEAAGARQVYPVRARGFSDYLTHAYYTEHDRAPSEQALKVALTTLCGQAVFEGATCEVFTRVAKTESGFWLDLCNDAWQAVQITATGWSVVAGRAVPLFTRSASMRPLPVPERGGTLDELWPLVNIPEPERLPVLAWLLECLRADTPHVVLELVGEQGSAKTSTQRALRRLIDPNQADLRAAPKSVEDVWIAARNSHMVSLENLSHLHPQYQDALCVLATGGGYSARTLYTNTEETILDLRRPIVLNGISVIVTQQDLLDRTLHVDLPTIHARELAGELEARFEAAHPKLLGALLDLFVKTLAELQTVVIAPEQRPRMADFAALGEAVFRVHGRPPGAFLDHYSTMRTDGVLRTIDASPVGAALIEYLRETADGFAGTLAELLSRLERHRPNGEAWPRSPKGLGDALRRLAPALRQVGYECKAGPKTGGTIRWYISRKASRPGPSPASPTSPAPDASNTACPRDPAGHSGHSGHGLGGQPPGEGYSRPDLRELARQQVKAAVASGRLAADELDDWLQDADDMPESVLDFLTERAAT